MENATGLTGAPDLTVNPGFGREAAHFISNFFSPPVLGALGILITAQSLGTLHAWTWSIFFAVTAVGIPVLYIVWQLHQGNITDFHLRIREERFKPMLVLVACLLIAIGSMITGNAPRALILTAVWGTSLSLFLLIITLFWKISGHSTAATSFAVFIYALHGAILTPIFFLVPLVGWARLRIRRHTSAQVLAGTLTGILFTTGFVFILSSLFSGVF